MGQRLFSVKDAAIAMEINKHKWLESEKAGRDIGFVAAAVDWLYKYSGSWNRYYSEKSFPERFFLERRELRRFNLAAYAKIFSPEGLCIGKIINLSFLGLLCSGSNNFQAGAKVRIYVRFGSDDKKSLSCIAVAERVFFTGKDSYEVFFRFSENIWQSLFSIDFIEKERIPSLK